MEIQLNQTESKGEFVAIKEGKEMGKMTFSKAGEDRIIIDHTEVNPEFKGLNVGNELVKAGVEYARQHQLKVIPLCPFANAIIRKNKDLQDVL